MAEEKYGESDINANEYCTFAYKKNEYLNE